MEDKRIKELRVQLGLSQERFAQLLSVSMQTVRRWESGLSRPLPAISLKLEELQREVRASKQQEGDVPMRRAGEAGQPGMEIGLGGLFKGIGSLFDLVARMTEEGSEEATGSGKLEGLGERLQGVYGFSVRTGLQGRPVIEQFGNLRETEEGPIVAETREPLVDVLDEGDRLVVIAEVPGIEEKDVQLNVEGDILEIAASTSDRKYRKEVLLPSTVESGSLECFYRNGVLEVRLAKQ
ncbi:MAG: archaeal heat shock protein Hsp20 [Dehalococcoidia bacterium]